jgi:iron complex outermembrane receptor protein
MAYIKAASASRSGGQNTRGLDAVTTLPFDPEKATDIEIGFKGQLFDNTLQLNMAYYHTFYEDIQQSNLINTPSGLITTVVNQAEADIDGLEVEAKWLVTENLQFSASLGLMNWAFKDDRSILPSAPTEEYAVRANYMIPTGYGRWLFDVNWTYRGEYFGNCAAGRDCIREFEPETGDSVDMWGARIGVDIDPLGLNVALWGRNLTDEKYVTPALQLYFPPDVTLSNGIIGAPRTYGVEVTYNF